MDEDNKQEGVPAEATPATPSEEGAAPAAPSEEGAAPSGDEPQG